VIQIEGTARDMGKQGNAREKELAQKAFLVSNEGESEKMGEGG